MTYFEALRELNDAAYRALRLAKSDPEAHKRLRAIAATVDTMVDAAAPTVALVALEAAE
jgi:CHASE3 domain sensor protein